MALVPRVSVIVPARNAEATIGRALEALARQELDGGYEVIVVDDGSTDSTVELIRSAPGPVRLVEQSTAGAGPARNRGVEASRGQAIAFCDADVFPTPGWLAAGSDALEDADMVQGKVLPDPGPKLGRFDRSLSITGPHGLWETANLFVTRELFERTGGFEQLLGPEVGRPMFEDTWFGWRACRVGARTAFCPTALAHHAVFPESWRQYVAERRRLRYFPLAAATMPELRRRLFYRRLFLSKRSAAFDALALAALAAAVLRSPLPLVAGVPYARMADCHPAAVAADLVGMASLAQGSVRYRSLLL